MILFLIMQAATGPDFDLARVGPPRPAGCASGAAGAVVVCGARPDRYRLPLPRDEVAEAEPSEASGTSAITPTGRCGVFAGERRCSKRDALAYGYGGGRDPIRAAVGVVAAIVDPDR